MKRKGSVSVVMPAHNEKESIIQVADSLMSLISERIHEIIIIVTPTSISETIEFADQVKDKYKNVIVEVQKVMPGIGNAYRQGYALARGDYVLNMESDGEMDVNVVPDMIKLMDEDYDLVQASRWCKGGGFENYDKFKLILNWGFQQIFHILFRTNILDLTFGFKIMRRQLAQGFKWEGTLHEFS